MVGGKNARLKMSGSGSTTLCGSQFGFIFFHLEVEKKAVVREGPRGKDVHFQENFWQDVPKMIFGLGLKERAGDRDSEGRIFTGRCKKEVGAE